MWESIPLSYYALAGLFNFITSAALAIVVFFRNPKSRTNQIFSLLAFTVAGWSLSYFLWMRAENGRVAEIYLRTLMVFVVFIPTAFTHFILNLLKKEDFAKRINFINYLISTLLGLTAYTSLFASDIGPFLVFPYWLKPRILFFFHTIHFFANIIYSHALMLRTLKSDSGILRNQVLYVFIGSAIGYIAGAINYLTWYRIPIPPFLNPLVSVYVACISYAIVKYRLMDIHVVITRTTVFMVVYALVLGMPLVGALAWQTRLEGLLGAKWWVWLWVVVALLATAAHYANLYLQGKAERRLLREQRRYQETLLQASHGMTQVRELKRLLNLIVHVITHAVGLSHAAVYLEEPKEETFVLSAFRYRRLVGSQERLPKDDPLIELLKQQREPLVLDELRAKFSETASRNGKRDKGALEAISRLQELNASMVVPGFMQEKLIGFLVLGEKRNRKIFTSEDLAVFSTLTNQAALAIENARFFEELKANEAYLIQSEKLASLGQLASGMAHEIHNPLAIISGEAQLYLERAKGKDEQVDKILGSIVEECFRAADITRRILRFAKPGKTELGPVDVRALIEESLQLVSYQVHLGRFERRVDVPADLPKIRGNHNQLQEVILNLILNACQAMGEERGGRIEVVAARLDGEVELRISDTGPGIPRSKLSKIFDPFYTTKHSGTGLGLFVSQRIIHAHNGTIEVRSIEGEGTTFTIRLPIFRESSTPLADPTANKVL